MNVEVALLAVGGDAENHHSLGHAREEKVRFLNRPCMGPSMLLHEQFAKGVRGLFSEKTVRSDNS